MTKAGKFATDVEALEAGWVVERIKLDNHRTVIATRPNERVYAEWHIDAGVCSFAAGEWSRAGFDNKSWTIIRRMLREMAKPPLQLAGDDYVRLPFTNRSPTEYVLGCVSGKTINWRNSITGKLESGNVPRGGLHLKHDPVKRTITFADGRGFHTVNISAIRSVE